MDYGTIDYGTIDYRTIDYRTIDYGTIDHGTIDHGTRLGGEPEFREQQAVKRDAGCGKQKAQARSTMDEHGWTRIFQKAED